MDHPDVSIDMIYVQNEYCAKSERAATAQKYSMT